MDSCRSGQFALLVHFRARWIPRGNRVCYWMGESIRRVIVLWKFLTSLHQSVYIHTCAVASHSLLHHCYQAQDTGTPRWTVRQQSATAGQKKQKHASNVHCYRWLPYSLNYLIIRYQDTFTHLSCSFWIYYEVTFYTASAYSAINPVICFMFSSNYRKALKRLIKCSFVQA